ncbi:surface protein [Drosophila miranda]|uniref:surface protein n=1 Tax=Drosophila miranda TaxID=7229 RepID=UPI0007E665EB|nr:surface protein [Drosophila miranda]
MCEIFVEQIFPRNMTDICEKDTEKDRQIRDVLCGMLDCVNSGLAPETVRICMELMGHGVQPKQLAEIIRTLKQEVPVVEVESGTVTPEDKETESDSLTIASNELSFDLIGNQGLDADSSSNTGLEVDAIASNELSSDLIDNQGLDADSSSNTGLEIDAMDSNELTSDLIDNQGLDTGSSSNTGLEIDAIPSEGLAENSLNVTELNPTSTENSITIESAKSSIISEEINKESNSDLSAKNAKNERILKRIKNPKLKSAIEDIIYDLSD